MITIKNSQRKFAIDIAALKSDIELILKALKYENFDIGVWLTTNKTIRFYNREYRYKDKATDVLSFPYHTDLKAGKRIKVHSEEDKNLGDLILSLEYIEKEAEKHKTTFYARLQHLIIHGICHLLGYDHIEDEDFRIMRIKEAFLHKALKKQ